MKSLISTITISAALNAGLLADGIPVDHETGEITAPHTVVTLNPDQQEELMSLDTVTLTAEQWAGLRKTSPGTPKRFESVVALDHDGCTCGPPLDFYCIAIDDTRIAVLRDHFEAEDLAIELAADYRHDCLHVDKRGQFYYLGCLVPFPMLLEAVSTPVRLVDGRPPRWPGVKVPHGMTRTAPTIRHRLTQLEAAAAKAGWLDVRPEEPGDE